MTQAFGRTLAIALTVFTTFVAARASAHDGVHDDKLLAAGLAAPADASGQPGSVAKVTRTVAITLSDAMRFNPSQLRFTRGQTIRLRITNAGRIVHEFVLGNQEEIAEHAQMMRQMPDTVHADAGSVRVAPGKSADLVWQFSESGKFLYACLIPGHGEAGMQGSITVTAPVER